MKRFSIGAMLVAGLLAFALAGCSGQSANGGDIKGGWILEDSSAVGFDAFLQFGEDGLAQYAVADSWIEGTWDVENGAAGATFADQAVKLSLNGDKLTLGSNDGSRLVFKRAGDDMTLESYLGENAGLAGGEVVEEQIDDIDPVVIADDETCTITVTGKGTDFTADPGYRLSISNKSDAAIFVSTMDKFKVNGTDIDAGIGEIVEAGSTADAFMYFSKDELGGALDKLVDTNGKLIVYDDKSGDEIASYDFHMD